MKVKELNVPELRFPGFDGKWNKIKIGSISQQITSGSRGWAQFYTPTGDKFIRMTNLQRDGNIRLILDDLKYVTIPENSTEGVRTSLQPGDILISITAELGKIGLITEDLGKAYINQHTALVRPKTDATEPAFLAYFLANPSSNKRFNRLNDSGAKAGLNLGTIRSFIFSAPPLPEQQKIASFLTAVNSKIEQLNKKKALLEQYKKGMMQKLFSQELRFKDEQGNEFPDWEEKRLGGVAEIVGGGTPETGNSDYWGGNIQWFTPTEIKQKYSSSSKRTITEDGLKKSSAKKLPIGTLLLSTRATVGDVAISIKECSTNQGFQSLVVKENNVNEYWYYWIKQNKTVLLRRSSGSTFLEISKSEISKIKVLRPHHSEQQKIAEFLSSIDKKINLISTELTQAQTFKKGLLQQMFI